MFRFTIRDVLWLMVVAGMGCGWWIERRSQQARITELTEMGWSQAIELAQFRLERFGNSHGPGLIPAPVKANE